MSEKNLFQREGDKSMSELKLICGWKAEFWWFPPRNRRGLFVLYMLPYEGYMHTVIGLWFVHIGLIRRWNAKRDLGFE